MARNYKYESAWVTIRGFANEGAWVYGTAEELTEVHERSERGVSVLQGHNSLDAARKRCEYRVRREAKASASWGVESYVSVMSAAEWLTE